MVKVIDKEKREMYMKAHKQHNKNTRRGAKTRMALCKYGAACSRQDCIYRHPKRDLNNTNDSQVEGGSGSGNSKKKNNGNSNNNNSSSSNNNNNKNASDNSSGNGNNNTTNNTPVCVQHLIGACAFGSKCRNRHVNGAKAKELLEKYARTPCRWGGECKNYNCLYYHPTDSNDSICLEVDDRGKNKNAKQNKKGKKNETGTNTNNAGTTTAPNAWGKKNKQGVEKEKEKSDLEAENIKPKPLPKPAPIPKENVWEKRAAEKLKTEKEKLAKANTVPTATQPVQSVPMPVATPAVAPTSPAATVPVPQPPMATTTTTTTQRGVLAQAASLLAPVNFPTKNEQLQQQQQIQQPFGEQPVGNNNGNGIGNFSMFSFSPFFGGTAQNLVPPLTSQGSKFVPIPDELWVNSFERNPGCFNIVDPMERFWEVNKVYQNNVGILDLHYQSKETAAVVLDNLLGNQNYGLWNADQQVWVITGTGHHTGGNKRESLFEVVQRYLDMYGYKYNIGKDKQGYQGAFLVTKLSSFMWG